jgi:DNA-binding XRE family transcriptional regulator
MKKDLEKRNIEKRKEWRTLLNEGLSDGSLELSQALRLLRKILDKNQVEYAKMVGVSKKIIADFEIGKGNPTIGTLNRLFAPIGFKAGLVKKSR